MTEYSAVRGTRLAWSSDGEGPAVIWAHAISSSRSAQERIGMFDWSPVPAAGHRLIRYDARGHGESGGAPGAQDYRFAELAKDLLALADEVAGERLSGIGSSMGTATLLHAAVQAPRRFAGLVLTAPPTAWEGRPPIASMYESTAARIEQDGLGAFTALMEQLPTPEIFGDLPGYPPPMEVAEALLPSVLRGAALSDLPARADLAALDLPVLVMAWPGDPVHSVGAAEELAAALPHADLRVASTPADLREWGDRAAAFLR
jgi:pimeloyl-ACP methyl ester carboxylesterase